MQLILLLPVGQTLKWVCTLSYSGLILKVLKHGLLILIPTHWLLVLIQWNRCTTWVILVQNGSVPTTRTRNGQESSKAWEAILLKEIQVTWNKQYSQESRKLTVYGCLEVHTCFLQNLPKIACFFKQVRLLEIRHYWLDRGGRRKDFK